MKAAIIPTITFTPGAANAGTLSFSALSGFDPRFLYAVINVTRNTILYAQGTPTVGGTFSGSTLTLALSTSSMSGADALMTIYEVAAGTALSNSASGTMGTSAAIVVPASTTRKWVTITNRTTGSETQDIGSSNVTVGGGIPLTPGGGYTFNGPGAAGPIYGITTIASSPFSYVEA